MHLLLCLWLLFVTQKLFGVELFEYYTPIRAIGMGGAYTAIASDENSIWTNPAGISRIRKARSRNGLHLLKIPNAIGGANKEGRSFYSDVQSQKDAASQSISPESGESSLANAVIKAVEAAGDDPANAKPFWARASINPIAYIEVAKDMAGTVGVYSNNTVKLVFDQDTRGDVSGLVDAVADAGGIFGFAYGTRMNNFNIGAQIRPVYRYSFLDKVGVVQLTNKGEISDILQNQSNKGTAVAADFGVLWTLNDFWFPTIGASMLNAPLGCFENYVNPYDNTPRTVCGTMYNGITNNRESLYVIDPTDFRVGLSITPRLTHKIGLRFAVDMHHLYVTDGTNYYGLPGVEGLKQFHGGVELFTGNPLAISPFSLRVGISQGFITGGASIRMSILALDFATYGRDIANGPTPREDRRYLGGLSLDF